MKEPAAGVTALPKAWSAGDEGVARTTQRRSSTGTSAHGRAVYAARERGQHSAAICGDTQIVVFYDRVTATVGKREVGVHWGMFWQTKSRICCRVSRGIHRKD